MPKAEFWTTEQVAEHVGITVAEVYQSRRRGDWPGNVGTNRGRRLLFRSDLIESGPVEPDTTNDPLVALLWTAQGIEAKVGEILAELSASQHIRMRRDLIPQWLNMEFTDETDSDGKPWETGEEE